MFDLIDPFWGYAAAFGAAAAGAAAVAYFVPQLRGAMLAAIAVGAAVLTIYRKGQKAQKEIEAKKKAKVIEKVQKEYKKIDERNTDWDYASDRLKKGTF